MLVRKVTSRREFLRTAVVGVAATSVLSACGAPATPAPATAAPKPTEAPKAPAAAAPTQAPTPDASRKMRQPNPAMITKASSGELPQIELVVAIQSGPEANAHVRNSPRFTEYTKGKVKVRVEEIGRDAWSSKLTTTMQSQSGAWDVVNSSGALYMLGANSGWYAPLDDMMKKPELFNDQYYKYSDVMQSAREAQTWKGVVYGLNQHLSAEMFHYRADLLKKYEVEPPDSTKGWTFDQVADAARKVKKGLAADKAGDDVWPLVVQLKTSKANASATLENIARSLGGKVYDSNGIPSYNIPEAKASIEMIKGWMDEGLVSPGSLGYEYAEVLELERQGKCVMAFEWDTAATELTDPEKSPLTASTLQFSIYPYGSAGATAPRLNKSSWINSVSAFSKQKDAAFAYCVWYTSPEIMYDLVMYGGGHAPRASLLGDEEVLSAHRQYKTMLENFKAHAPWPPIAQYNYLVSTILNSHLAAYYAGKKTSQQALDDAQKESIEYLKSQSVAV